MNHVHKAPDRSRVLLMARGPRRFTWLVVLILGLMAVGMAVKALRADAGEQDRNLTLPMPVQINRVLHETDTAQVFREVDEGDHVTVAVGERFAVVLSSWAEWRVEAAPDFVRQVDARIDSSQAGSVAGGDSWQITVFEVTEAGEGELRFVLGRPWMEGDRLSEYRLTLRAEARVAR